MRLGGETYIHVFICRALRHELRHPDAQWDVLDKILVSAQFFRKITDLEITEHFSIQQETHLQLSTAENLINPNLNIDISKIRHSMSTQL